MTGKKPSAIRKTTKKKTVPKKSAGKKCAQKKTAGHEAGLREKADRMTEDDISGIVEREKEIGEKLRKVPGKFRKIVNQVRLLYSMMRDFRSGAYRGVPWHSIAMAAAAMLYFLNPLDFIPDWLFITGFLDDAAVLALAFRALRGDLLKYCAFKGHDPEMYF